MINLKCIKLQNGHIIPKCQYYDRYNHYLLGQLVFAWFILDCDHIKAKARNINEYECYNICDPGPASVRGAVKKTRTKSIRV